MLLFIKANTSIHLTEGRMWVSGRRLRSHSPRGLKTHISTDVDCDSDEEMVHANPRFGGYFGRSKNPNASGEKSILRAEVCEIKRQNRAIAQSSSFQFQDK